MTLYILQRNNSSLHIHEEWKGRIETMAAKKKAKKKKKH